MRFMCLPHRHVALALAVASLTVCTAQDLPQSESHLHTAPVVAQADRVGVRHAMPVQSADTADFMLRAVSSTADALSRFAGVTLRDYGGAGGLKTISVRGLGAQHTVVCHDGIVVSDSRSGTIDLSRFPIEDLFSIQLSISDQTELLCPARQLGAATLQFRSLRPDTARHGLQGRLTLHQGSFGLWQPSLRLGHSIGKRHTLGVAAGWLHAVNDYPFHISNGLASHDEDRLHNRVDDWHVDADYAGRVSECGSVTAKARFSRSQRQLPGPVVLYVSGNSEDIGEREALLQARYDLVRGEWHFMAAGKGTWNESRYRDRDDGYPDGELRQNYWQRELYATVGIGWSRGLLSLAYAADGVFQSLNSSLATDNHASRSSLLQSISLRLQTRRWELTARALLQLHANHVRGNDVSAPNAGRLTPSLSLRCLVIDGRDFRLRARAYYNNVYRQPTFTENYFYHYGNPHLRPEKAQQLGIGLTAELTTIETLTVGITADAYSNHVRDKIVSVPVTTWLWQTQNMGCVRASGIDVTAQMIWKPAERHSIGLHGNYTWQQVRDRSDKALRSYNLQLAYTPLHSGSVSLSWENPWLSLSASLTGCSPRWSTHTHTETTRLPGYETVNLSAWHGFAFPNRKRFLLRADITNLLGKAYEVVRRYPMPGRSYRISAEFDF